MRTYTIAKKAESWDQIERLPIDLVQLNSGAPIKAYAQICYDNEALYIRETSARIFSSTAVSRMYNASLT